jgi:hypothetical protein
MKKTIFPLASILFLLILNMPLSSQPPDSCLKMVFPNNCWDTLNHTGYFNPDSVKVDSCPGSPSYGKCFAKRYYQISFVYPLYPFDSIIRLNDIKRVSDISDRHPQLKQRFMELDSIFGPIYFTEIEDYSMYPDSILLMSPAIIIYFEGYQDIDSITNYFKNTIDSVRWVVYLNRAGLPTIVNDNKFNNLIKLYPNPVDNFVQITLSNLNEQSKVQIFSSQGFIVMESELKDKIDVSSLPKGVYFLKVGNTVLKFLKL